MKAEKFVKSWPALWLWMNTLNTILCDAKIEYIYTFRKARLDIHFETEGNQYRLSWEKQGNQAILTGATQVTLPRRRIDLFRGLSSNSVVSDVQIHSQDRLIRINLRSGQYFVIGFYPAVLNVYLHHDHELMDTFLKQEDIPHVSDQWLNNESPLPDDIPGTQLSKHELEEARLGISFDVESGNVIFGAAHPLDIQALTIEVLRIGRRPKAAPAVSLDKIARTVRTRWKNKLSNIQKELAEAETWPELEIRLQAMQIGMGIGQTPTGGILELPAPVSPTGIPIQIQLEPNTTIHQSIEAIAKKIRKFKGKLNQLGAIQDHIITDLQILDKLIDENDSGKLQTFLESQGEALDRSGHQRSKRKPYKKYTSPSQFDILVGRSSSDNDTLTFKVAGKNDWWFHARQVRGSHVILRTGNQMPLPADIRKAAEYAARNSKAKHARIVVVQYCQRKHLSKSKGAPPGTVMVHHEKSITIDLEAL